MTDLPEGVERRTFAAGRHVLYDGIDFGLHDV